MPDFDLSPLECRVLGCLLEKQLSTPDVYPLSMNSLLNACNQSSNREPVLALTEADVQETVQASRECFEPSFMVWIWSWHW